MIPDHILDQIRRDTDLPALMREYGIDLRKIPGGFTGLCFVHQEKTPSLRVNTTGERRGSYHCFGCAAHGSAINFLMAMENIPFPAAAERLALRAGIPINGKRQTPVHRAAAAEDAEISPWWWKRHVSAVRACLDHAMQDEDFEFAECCGNLLRTIQAMPPAEKLRLFTFNATSAERKEYRAERAWDAGYRDVILAILEAAA